MAFFNKVKRMIEFLVALDLPLACLRLRSRLANGVAPVRIWYIFKA